MILNIFFKKSEKSIKKWQITRKRKKKRKAVSLSSPVYPPRQSDERGRRNRCTLKNSPTVKGRDGEKSNLGEGWSGIGQHKRKAKAKCERWAREKGISRYWGTCRKTNEDRGRLKNIHLSFVCMDVSFLILLLPDYRSFPTAWHFARNRVA